MYIAVKGYLRKGAILTAMKEHTKAAQCFTKALEIDPNNAVSDMSVLLKKNTYVRVLSRLGFRRLQL